MIDPLLDANGDDERRTPSPDSWPDLERALSHAFGSRPVPGGVRSSLGDVRRRARRRHQRRSASMIGALAVVGVGGAAALAVRHDGPKGIGVGGTGDLGGPSTTACVPVTTIEFVGEPAGTTTTMPPTTQLALDATSTTVPEPTTSVAVGGFDPCTGSPPQWWQCLGPLPTTTDLPVTDLAGNGSWSLFAHCEPIADGSPFATTTTIDPNAPTGSVNGNVDATSTTGTIPATTSVVGGATSSGEYTVQQGDTPAAVAERFAVTLDALDAANADNPGYPSFYVGLVIVIPGSVPTSAPLP